MSGTLLYDTTDGLTLTIKDLAVPIQWNDSTVGAVSTMIFNLSSCGIKFKTNSPSVPSFDSTHASISVISTVDPDPIYSNGFILNVPVLFPGAIIFNAIIFSPQIHTIGLVSGLTIKINPSLIVTPPTSSLTDALSTIGPLAITLQQLYTATPTLTIPLTITCFHPESLIKMNDGNYKEIKFIEKGDILDNNKVVRDVFAFPIGNTITFYKIKKDKFGYNIPSSDVYLTKHHKVRCNKMPMPVQFIGEKIALHVDYVYHLQLDENGIENFIDCSGIFADVWCNDNTNAFRFKSMSKYKIRKIKIIPLTSLIEVA